MSLQNTQNLVTDLCRDNAQRILVKQYEKNSRFILIKCTENGKFYPLSNKNTKCNIKMLTPDNRAIYNPCEILDNGLVRVSISESMVHAAGVAHAELNVIDLEDSSVIATMSFDLVIKASPYPEERIIDSDEFSTLLEIIANEKKRIDAMLELEMTVYNNEEIRKDNETDRILAEENREDAENYRSLNEHDRISNEAQRSENEMTRISNERDRIESELIRESSEEIRIGNEEERQFQERLRRIQENKRRQNEKERIINEHARMEHEQIRISNEDLRETNEIVRTTEEDIRAENEVLRRMAEMERAESEIDRIINENVRLYAEKLRSYAEKFRTAFEENRREHEMEREDAEELRRLQIERIIDDINLVRDRAIAAALACENIVIGYGFIPVAEKGTANGVATLNKYGIVPSNQLPSYVDQVREGTAVGVTKNPETGNLTATGFILTGALEECVPTPSVVYLDTTNNVQYRWTGSMFITTGTALALGELPSTAFYGNLGKIAYDHSQSPHAQVGATKVEKSPTNGNLIIDGVDTNVYTLDIKVDSALSDTSTNPVQNKVIKNALDNMGTFIASASAPSKKNVLWIDTSMGGVMKYYNGSAWVAVKAVWG